MIFVWIWILLAKSRASWTELSELNRLTRETGIPSFQGWSERHKQSGQAHCSRFSRPHRLSDGQNPSPALDGSFAGSGCFFSGNDRFGFNPYRYGVQTSLRNAFGPLGTLVLAAGSFLQSIYYFKMDEFQQYVLLFQMAQKLVAKQWVTYGNHCH